MGLRAEGQPAAPQTYIGGKVRVSPEAIDAGIRAVHPSADKYAYTAVAAAYPVIRADVIAEVVTALRVNGAPVSADLVEREFGPKEGTE